MKTILLFGLRRSGNHFIISTILQQFDLSVHINDVNLSYDKYSEFKNINITSKRANNYIGFKNADCVIISMENKIIDFKEYQKLISILKNYFKDKKYLIHIFFESKTILGYGNTNIQEIDKNIFDIKSLLGENIILHENEYILNDYLKFVYADYLFIGNSCFSISATFFNKNKVIYCFNDILNFCYDTYDKVIITSLKNLEEKL